MKKNTVKITLIVVISIALCLCFIGCGGGGKPKDMDQKTYDLGTQAVVVANDYLAGKISKSDAYNTLKDIDNKLYDFSPTSSGATTYGQVSGSVFALRSALEPEANRSALMPKSFYNDLDFEKDLGHLKEILNMK